MQQLLPPQLVGLLLGAMTLVTVFTPWPTLPWPVRAVGVVPIVAGLFITVRHARLFDTVGTNIKTFDDPGVLVTSDAFRWTRNPMYLGFVLLLAGVALALGSLTALIGPVAFFVAADRWYVPFEEQRMATIFGAEYDEYRNRVRRWIGRVEAT